MIHALPGMGADRRMYPTPWTSLPGFVADDWMRHSGERTLRDVAESMCLACEIRDDDVLVGASLGGMVACEITKIRKIPVLFLLGSATCREEVSPILAALRPLVRFAPVDWLRFSAGRIPLELPRMFSEAEPSFIRAMCEAVFQWEGLGPTETKVSRIPGAQDRVIPPPPRADLLLDAGHLISMTRARECAEFVQNCKPDTVLP